MRPNNGRCTNNRGSSRPYTYRMRGKLTDGGTRQTADGDGLGESSSRPGGKEIRGHSMQKCPPRHRRKPRVFGTEPSYSKFRRTGRSEERNAEKGTRNTSPENTDCFDRKGHDHRTPPPCITCIRKARKHTSTQTKRDKAFHHRREH